MSLCTKLEYPSFSFTSFDLKKKTTKLKNEAKVTITKQEDLCNLIREYFLNIYVGRQGDVSPVINVIPNWIIEEDNALLMAPFPKDEFRAAIFSMHSIKVDGLDRLNP